MCRGLLVSLLYILLILGAVPGLSCYRWVSLKSGDPIPSAALVNDYSSETIVYIGRARHFDEVLPALIYPNGTATISSCEKEILKEESEILTVSEYCEWKTFKEFSDIDDTIVRVGTAWNGEPIFVGHYFYDYYDPGRNEINYIYLTRRNVYHWKTYGEHYSPHYFQYLSCNTGNKWIDTPVSKLPNNTVSGGKSEDGYDIYVARLKRGCDVVSGQAIPETGVATAFLNDDTAIEAHYCQVLVREANEYTWVSASDGEIPDYAVIVGQKDKEPSFVARFNNTIGHLTHEEALLGQMDYEILVANKIYFEW